jgi:hypothetical protein
MGSRMSKLREWALDWLDRSDTQPSDRKLGDPLAIMQRVFATLAALVALASSPAISAFAPNMSPAARLALQVLVALITLVAVHHVVTAKDVREVASGHRVRAQRSYRFSQLERLIARGVVALAIVLFALNMIPAPAPPKPCNFTAIVTWPAAGTARPLYLALNAGGREERYDLEAGKPVALQVAPAHASAFSVALLWSDGARSDFGKFSGCPAAVNRASQDGRARIEVAGN